VLGESLKVGLSGRLRIMLRYLGEQSTLGGIGSSGKDGRGWLMSLEGLTQSIDYLKKLLKGFFKREELMDGAAKL